MWHKELAAEIVCNGLLLTKSDVVKALFYLGFVKSKEQILASLQVNSMTTVVNYFE
jgi:hypothetical protein